MPVLYTWYNVPVSTTLYNILQKPPYIYSMPSHIDINTVYYTIVVSWGWSEIWDIALGNMGNTGGFPAATHTILTVYVPDIPDYRVSLPVYTVATLL